MTTCSVCGGQEFHDDKVLWPDLIAQWELAPWEVEYIDRQQGRRCNICGANLRSIALGNALRRAFCTRQTLAEFVHSEAARRFRVLEINGAGNLSEVLAQMPQHRLVRYPDVDMLHLPYEDGSFDIVVHSDTLEHVLDPILGLSECRRVLAADGCMCFTIPMVVGRMTRSRAGLPKSYHGIPGGNADDYLVHTEFGADAWTTVVQAGFSELMITAVAFPAATALTALRGNAAGKSWPEDRVRSLDSEVAQLQRRLDEQARVIDAVKGSTSWRVTAPLRFIARSVRGMLRR
jgi:SAM-dependent methyltransferase